MQLFRKYLAAIMAVSILLVTALPGMPAAACEMPGMSGLTAQMQMKPQIEPVTPFIGGQECYVECGCRIDNHIDGMPHQLAPHALSTAADVIAQTALLVVGHAPQLSARLQSQPAPPP